MVYYYVGNKNQIHIIISSGRNFVLLLKNKNTDFLKYIQRSDEADH